MNSLNFKWFAINTRSKYEEFVSKQVLGKGFETFLPMHKSRRRWSDRIKEQDVPTFPGYIFCRLDANDRLPILMTPGVIQIVGAGKTPIPVEDAEIAAIRKAVDAQVGREPWSFLSVGERVRVEHGPLTGVEGILTSVKGGHRLILSVTLLQRSLALEIDSAWVTALPQQRQPVRPPQASSVQQLLS